MAKTFTANQIRYLNLLGKTASADRETTYQNFLSLRQDGITSAKNFLDYLRQRYQYRVQQEWRNRKVYLGD